MAIKDWRVWATRPCAQNKSWVVSLHELGYQTLDLPLLDIVPLTDPASAQAIKNLIMDFDQFEKVIFVSQNAVHHAFEWLHDYWPQLPQGIEYFAVGAKTAQTVAAEGVAVHAGATSMDTEALLALPELLEVWGKKILICRGRGGLPKLGQALHQRGAMVRYLELYERLLPSGAESQLTEQLNGIESRDLLVAFSGETLHNLLSVLAATGIDALHNPLLVPGKRLEELAVSLGFSWVINAPNASEAAMLSSLTTFTSAHTPR